MTARAPRSATDPEHEEIYLAPICHRQDPDGRSWATDTPWDECDCEHGPVRFVRADIAQARVRQARADALQEVCDAAIRRGLATGHGDTIDDVVGEIVTHAAEIERRQWEVARAAALEAAAVVAEQTRASQMAHADTCSVVAVRIRRLKEIP